MYAVLLYDCPSYFFAKIEIWVTIFTGKDVGFDGVELRSRNLLMTKIMTVRIALFSYYYL
jgi:hypothetical protein